MKERWGLIFLKKITWMVCKGFSFKVTLFISSSRLYTLNFICFSQEQYCYMIDCFLLCLDFKITIPYLFVVIILLI